MRRQLSARQPCQLVLWQINRAHVKLNLLDSSLSMLKVWCCLFKSQPNSISSYLLCNLCHELLFQRYSYWWPFFFIKPCALLQSTYDVYHSIILCGRLKVLLPYLSKIQPMLTLYANKRRPSLHTRPLTCDWTRQKITCWYEGCQTHYKVCFD